MKNTLSMITLAVLTVGLLGSCSKINERLDNLEKKVDGLENEKIASIENQITGINSSIADLGTIRSNIQSLTDEAKAQGQDITDLQAADKALGKRIEELSKYVGDTLKAYATEEWARATFSTLGQYEKTCDTIAKIDARIGALDENLSKKIADCADSLTTWINGQFEAYYTAAEMDAKTDAMQAEIDSARAANLITDAKADSLAVELAKVQPSIDSAKATLTAEYTAAIDTAITTLDGKLTKQIQDEIEKVNEAVAALAQRVGILEFQVRDLLGRVGALEGMIQSVTILPAYSDGSLKVENDSLHIDCIITPASATRWLGIRNFSILVKGVAVTKAGVETIRIASPWDLKIDWTRGTASIKVKIADKLPGNDSTLTVALNVKDTRNGSDYTTEFVPVYAAPPAPYVEIAAKYDGEDKPVRTLKWYRQNLAITTSGKKSWKGDNPTAVKVPGTDDDVVNGDYFQWGASYDGYFLTGENRKPQNLLLYTSFKSKACGDDEDAVELAGEIPFAPDAFPYYSTLKNEEDSYIYKYRIEDEEDEEDEGDEGDGRTVLEPDDDVAHIMLGGTWRMPKIEELKGLFYATYWQWDSVDKGYYVYTPAAGDAGKCNDQKTSLHTYRKDDALLFFPAAGHCANTGFTSGATGYFWSGNLVETNDNNARRFKFYIPDGFALYSNTDSRGYGCSIRPVSE